MYRDNDVDKYYDTSLLANYGKRYSLFLGVILCLAVTAIVVPIILRIFKKPEPEKAPKDSDQQTA